MPLNLPLLSHEIHADADMQAREQAQIYFLAELQQFPLVFKGGTALRLIHGSGRFSEDLDFDLSQPMADAERLTLAESIRKHLETREGNWVKDKRVYGDEEQFNYYFRARYKIGSQKPRSVKIEISRYKPGSDVATFPLHEKTNTPLDVRAYDLDMLMTGKLNALFTRSTLGKRQIKGRDVYDFLQFGNKRSFKLDHLDDYQANNALWFTEKIAEVQQLAKEQKEDILKDIASMLPVDSHFTDADFNQFLKILHRLESL